jgi:hypothetical protein
MTILAYGYHFKSAWETVKNIQKFTPIYLYIIVKIDRSGQIRLLLCSTRRVVSKWHSFRLTKGIVRVFGTTSFRVVDYIYLLSFGRHFFDK